MTLPPPRTLTRRALIGSTGLALAVTGASHAAGGGAGQRLPDTVSVLTATSPDPVPPGPDSYSRALVQTWERRNAAAILTESAAIQNILPKLQLNFQAGRHVYDIVYSGGWLPEISPHLSRLNELIPSGLRADIAPSSFNAVTWDDTTYGLPYSGNLMILYVNSALLDAAGIAAPPTTWDELLGSARALTRDGVAGFALPIGQVEGIGGLASHWIILLQQAGGRLFDDRGLPDFVDHAGVSALQLLIDLAPSIDPFGLADRHVNDVVVSFLQGRTAMMMGWASTYPLLVDPTISSVADRVGMATLPAGPAGSASIDAGDAWAIANRSWVVGKAMSLIRLYLDPRAQRQLCLTTGALPVRLSVLEEPAVIAAAPQAVVVREQMRSPFDNFLRPGYAVVTSIIGEEIAGAMRGLKSPGQALRDAADTLRQLGRAR